MSSYELQELLSELESSVNGMNSFSNILSLVAYVLLALGMYTIAKRRGINKAWLAWVPVCGNMWILGCISDQYNYVVKRQNKAKRKTLVWLEAIMLVLLVVMIVFVVMMIVNLVASGAIDSEYMSESDAMELIPSLIGIIVSALALMGVAIALSIVQYMAYYDLFCSCDPANKGVYTAVGIIASLFGFGIVLAIFVFICRNKEGGMPPRMDTVSPESTFVPPSYTPPAYTPPTHTEGEFPAAKTDKQDPWDF